MTDKQTMKSYVYTDEILEVSSREDLTITDKQGIIRAIIIKIMNDHEIIWEK
jgi:hypothetical protein